jgi:hypothetical protein
VVSSYKYSGKHWLFDTISKSIVVSLIKAEKSLLDPIPLTQITILGFSSGEYFGDLRYNLKIKYQSKPKLIRIIVYRIILKSLKNNS